MNPRNDQSEQACEVLIVGGGPTGLLLAGLLAQRDVDVAVLERRTAPHTHSRAIGLHPPALRVLEALDLADAAVAGGAAIGRGQARARGRPLGTVSFERAWPERPFVLALPQTRTEALLTGRLAELAPGALHRGWQVRDLEDLGGQVRVRAQHPDGGSATLRARVVVGADGARSVVRDLAGIRARLRTYPDTYLMGDVADTSSVPDTAVIHLEADGVVESFPLPGARRRWVAHTGRAPATASASRVPDTPGELAEIVARRTGERIDPGTCTMISAFRVRRRTAERMVAGQVVLIGDAAHEISPIGGQGMTLGWLDALSLAPLLEDVVHLGLRRPLRHLPGMHRFEAERLAAAQWAGRVAGVNTALGRPLPAPLAAVRDVGLSALLRTPLRHRLARAYSMRWASGRGRRDDPRR